VRVEPEAIDFRPLQRDDFARFDEWVRRPHVARWWAEPVGLDAIEAEYGPAVDGTDPTAGFLILVAGGPVGFIQCYRLADEPAYRAAVGVDDAAGIDLFVGEADVMGDGFGSTVLRRFLDLVVWPRYPEVRRAMAGPSVHNGRSQRAFEKAGFVRTRVVDVPDEPEPELVMLCERPRPSG
jgi:aminoglycoside 6'-N-acetyltransferase